MADLGVNGQSVTADMPMRNAFFIEQTGVLFTADLPVRNALIIVQDGVLFTAAGTLPCTAGGSAIPKRWNPGTEEWEVIPGP